MCIRDSGSHGYYHLEDKRIAINEGMSELQTLKTAIHEIAHAKLHDIDLNAPKDEQPRVDRRTDVYKRQSRPSGRGKGGYPQRKETCTGAHL